MAIYTRMRINAVLFLLSFLFITIELDFYVKIDIINYTFALKYNLRQVADKSPRLRYLNEEVYESLGVFKVLI